MTMHFVLVHAPVLGPASWHPVRDELVQAGYQATVPSLADFAADGPPYAPRLVAQFAAQQQARQGPADLVVLVLHSGAGVFADQLATASTGAAVAVIFADAGLPSRSGVTPVVDQEFLPYLREIAANGMVPAWPDWWPDADPAEVFPTEAARMAVLADARPLPLAFFEETLPPPASGRPSPPAGYLLFSEGYREAAEQARSRGWPVAELSGSHLQTLVQPAQVATALIELAERLQLP